MMIFIMVMIMIDTQHGDNPKGLQLSTHFQSFLEVAKGSPSFFSGSGEYRPEHVSRFKVNRPFDNRTLCAAFK